MLAKLRAWLLTAPLIVLLTAICGTISWLLALADRSGRMPHGVARVWARLLLAVSGVRVRVEGLENISPEGAYVFASNHLSLMDTPLVLANIPVQFRFLAKRSLYRVPFIGSHLRRAGHIPVERQDPRAALRTLGEAARIVRQRGVSVLVFPEGSRSRGPLGEFKPGAAYIAIKAGVPLVPLAIRGTAEILPAGSLTVRPGEARLRVGRPIPTTGFGVHDHTRLTGLLRERIGELLGERACTPA
ncbi:MAG: lysophospholipid acyltransferase family protein [Bryobacterales bacterium]|nr:1-acyl-sn-glycerol-3-phosphate acyltransferase [Bryobacteraceae bacterium]MDW8131802.1 lysophospholipid acyltransferase family protein [Bryobacterales bacterium]